ncbi:MAG: PH domain-containing protein [Nitrospinae bacterium]|nr:PH domain-containing protein [Nitrospinota bacterium]
MSYIHKSLLEGEEIVYLTRRHKIIFTYPVIWLLLSAILFGVKWVFVLKPEINFALSIFSGIFLAAALIHALVIWVLYISAEFGITNQRVIVKEGFLKRKTVEVFLKSVESVQVDQSIWGRILNFGTVIVSGTGGVTDPLNMIRKPLEFKKQVQQRLAGI